MRIQISVYNTVNGQKDIRYNMDASKVHNCAKKLMAEVENEANSIVLIELVN